MRWSPGSRLGRDKPVRTICQELLVHFGACPSTTLQRAAMTASAISRAGRDGFAFSNDGWVRRGARVVVPPADCPSAFDFRTELARRFGWEEQFPWLAEHAVSGVPAIVHREDHPLDEARSPPRRPHS